MTPDYGVEDILRVAEPGAQVLGDDAARFRRAAPAGDADIDSLTWIRPTHPDRQRLLDETAAGVVLCDESVDPSPAVSSGKTVIVVANPKVVFSRTVAALFVSEPAWGIHPSAVLHEEAEIADGVSIGPNCSVGRAQIGEGTVIHGNCLVYDGVRLGRNVTIHAGTVLGGDGFGYERDETGEVEKFPHVGAVIVEDEVEIHSCTAVDRGSLKDTRIRRGAKIDNLVHIAHNADIGEGSFVIAHAMVGGSVKIGKNCWIGPGAVIRDNLEIGDDAFVGIGALVVKDVPPGAVHMGSPARDADEYKALLQSFRELLAARA
ncbi:MAG TPA: UDP-3-O-(3-hydroxymyristoyl)glucosamine N-acyltransferase [Gaiellaceae bacterium]|nr:UDP-3-O-(3-hydroxymyristoyl)glucosamine N-acyltransferase [Gaiellaceae bacterium]